MPNWSTSIIKICGSQASITAFLNKARNVKKLGKVNSSEQFIEQVMKFNDYECGLSSWRKCPNTFNKWDTTNSMRQRDAIDYETNKPMFNSDEEYEQYCKGYKNAVKYQKRKYGIVGWYDYHCHIWGTKWDAAVEFCSVIVLDNEKFELVLRTETAWSAPYRWLDYIKQQFPDLDIVISSVNEGDPSERIIYDFQTGEETVEVDEEIRRWLMGQDEPNEIPLAE